ncbi:hypothetical protein V8F20_004727 [Naviculisporaceae sp. PSN 640]
MDPQLDFDPPLPPSRSPATLDRDINQESGHDIRAPEEGFEISPFCSPVINLRFRDDLPLTIHRTFLLKSAKLALLCQPTTKALDLSQISGGAGHIIVQYLYTSRYYGLEWRGAPRSDATVGRFKTAVEVYAAAREYGLNGLEELAKEEIAKEGSELHAFTIIDAVKDVYPTPTQDDVWFPDYTKTRIKAALENPADLLSAPFQIDFGEPMSIAKVVFRGMLEVYCEMLQSLTRGTPQVLVVPKPLAEPPEDHIARAGSVRQPPKVDESAPQNANGGNEFLLEDTTQTQKHNSSEARQEDSPTVEETALPLRPAIYGLDCGIGLDVQDSPPETDTSKDKSAGNEMSSGRDGVAPPQAVIPPLPRNKEPGPQSPVRLNAIVETRDSTPSTTDVSEPRVDKSFHQDVPPRTELSSRVGSDSPATVAHVLQNTQESYLSSARTTPSPPKDGDEFWANLAKRRKERIGAGKRASVTFDIPDQKPASPIPGIASDSGKKGKELSGTAPEFVPRSQMLQSVGGLEQTPFGPELTSLTHQPGSLLPAVDRFMPPEGDDVQPAPLYDVKEPFRQDLVVAPMFSPRSDPGISDVPELVPPDPSIWGPIGSGYSKPKNSDPVSERPALGARLDRDLELTTPEPVTPNDKWEPWGGRLSRKRTLSMSLSLNAFTAADLKDPELKPRPVSSLWSIRSKERLDEPAVIDDSNGGARATPEPEPEPTSGVTLLQDDSNDPWNQPGSSSPTRNANSHPMPRKKRSKRSRRLRALAEEQGLALSDRADGDFGGSDVLSQSTADEHEPQNVDELTSSTSKRLAQGLGKR